MRPHILCLHTLIHTLTVCLHAYTCKEGTFVSTSHTLVDYKIYQLLSQFNIFRVKAPSDWLPAKVACNKGTHTSHKMNVHLAAGWWLFATLHIYCTGACFLTYTLREMNILAQASTSGWRRAPTVRLGSDNILPAASECLQHVAIRLSSTVQGRGSV